MSPPVGQTFKPDAPEPQGQVYTADSWGTCEPSGRLLLEDADGNVFRSCVASGVVVPTIPLGVNELANLLWPGGWSFFGGQ